MVEAVELMPPSPALPHPLAHVLLAEDDPHFRDLIACYLRRAGYRVSRVGDAPGLLKRLGGADPSGAAPPVDVIVSDIYMPGGNGLGVLEGLRAEGFRVPVILMTAFGDESVHEQGRRLGAQAVLDKPFDLRALVSEVDRACFREG